MTELERALVSLGRGLDLPDAPDVAPAVLARLEPRPAPLRARLLVERRRSAVAIAVAVLAAIGATLAVPDARSALFRFLDIGGERIEFVDELPEVRPQPAELDLDVTLGERVSLAEARRRADFALRELDEEPDRVYLGERGTVWFLYGSPDRVRLLVAQTPRLRVDEEFILKKLVPAGTQVEPVSVAGTRGYFISGEPHVVYLVDETGQPVEESARLAEDVLIWEDGGISFRLEGDFSRDDAIELAESLR
jgi:hypothetical protein